jgi:hypothetical protein
MSNYQAYHCYQLHTKFCPIPYTYKKLLNVIILGFNVKYQLLYQLSDFFSCVCVCVFFLFLFKCWRKKLEYNETVHQLFIDFKKLNDSLTKGVSCNIQVATVSSGP